MRICSRCVLTNAPRSKFDSAYRASSLAAASDALIDEGEDEEELESDGQGFEDGEDDEDDEDDEDYNEDYLDVDDLELHLTGEYGDDTEVELSDSSEAERVAGLPPTESDNGERGQRYTLAVDREGISTSINRCRSNQETYSYNSKHLYRRR